jgi:hypothetical protein
MSEIAMAYCRVSVEDWGTSVILEDHHGVRFLVRKDDIPGVIRQLADPGTWQPSPTSAGTDDDSFVD